MTDIIRAEMPHAINGVPGRLFTLRRPPAPWKAGTFANQSWASQQRSAVSLGYAPGSYIQVSIRFDDECRNGRNTFSITANIRELGRRDCVAGGCLHDEVEKVFPELAHLIKWRLYSTDGPMHYVANTMYHAKQHGPNRAWVYYKGQGDPLNIGEANRDRLLGYVDADEARRAEGQPGYRVEWDMKTEKVRNLKYARSSACWPEATDEQLCAPQAELEAALRARLPALLKAFRADMEAAGFLWECPVEALA